MVGTSGVEQFHVGGGFFRYLGPMLLTAFLDQYQISGYLALFYQLGQDNAACWQSQGCPIETSAIPSYCCIQISLLSHTKVNNSHISPYALCPQC